MAMKHFETDAGFYKKLATIAFPVAMQSVITMLKTPVINSYNITDETKQIAHQLMNAISFIVVFRSANMILTKGVLRGGGDTRFLVLADTSMMWLIAIPWVRRRACG